MSLAEKIKNAVKDYAQFLTIPIPFVGDYVASKPAFGDNKTKGAKGATAYHTVCFGTLKLYSLASMLLGDAPGLGGYIAVCGVNIIMYNGCIYNNFSTVGKLLDEMENESKANS